MSVTLCASVVFLLLAGIRFPGLDAWSPEYWNSLTIGTRFLDRPEPAWRILGLPREHMTSLLLLWLVVYRGALFMRTGPRPEVTRRDTSTLTFVVYLLGGVGLSVTVLAHLYNYGATANDFVFFGGPVFWGKAGAGLALFLSLLWFLADWISRSGIGSGPVVLGGVGLYFANGLQLLEQGKGYFAGSIAGSDLALGLLFCGAPALVVLALGFVAKRPWPVSLSGRLQLRSPLDAVILPSVLPWIGASLVRLLLDALQPIATTTPPWLPILEDVAALSIAAFFAVLLLKRGRRTAQPHRLAAAVVFPLPAMAVVLTGYGLAAEQWSRSAERYLGPASKKLLLHSRDGKGQDDAPIIVKRFRHLGIRAEAEAVDQGRIILKLDGVAPDYWPSSLLLARGQISIAAVDFNRWTPCFRGGSVGEKKVGYRCSADQCGLFPVEEPPLAERANILRGKLVKDEKPRLDLLVDERTARAIDEAKRAARAEKRYRSLGLIIDDSLYARLRWRKDRRLAVQVRSWKWTCIAASELATVAAILEAGRLQGDWWALPEPGPERDEKRNLSQASLESDELPLLPLRHVVPFPGASFDTAVHRPSGVAAIRAARMGGTGRVALVTQRSRYDLRPGRADLHDFGAVGRIVTGMDVLGRTYAVFEPQRRIRILELTGDTPFLRARVEYLDDGEPELDAEVVAAFKATASEYARAAGWSQKTTTWIEQHEDPVLLMGRVLGVLRVRDLAEKVRIIGERDPNDSLRLGRSLLEASLSHLRRRPKRETQGVASQVQ